jgi:hypothetical protein
MQPSIGKSKRQQRQLSSRPSFTCLRLSEGKPLL